MYAWWGGKRGTRSKLSRGGWRLGFEVRLRGIGAARWSSGMELCVELELCEDDGSRENDEERVSFYLQ